MDGESGTVIATYIGRKGTAETKRISDLSFMGWLHTTKRQRFLS